MLFRSAQEKNVFISDTRDSTGGMRFGVGAKFASTYNGWRLPTSPKQLHRRYGLEMNPGINASSEQQFAFHLKDDMPMLRQQRPKGTVAELILRYHALLYHWCDG